MPVAMKVRRLKTGRLKLVNTPVQSEGNGNRRSIGSHLVRRRIKAARFPNINMNVNQNGVGRR
jgi:hypothetical protein